jgi:hypothetical protein
MRRAREIGVLTFHRCINYGSYWQARCLVDGLRARGHDAVLIDYTCRDATFAEWRCACQPLLPQRSSRSDARAYADKVRKFLTAIEELPRAAPFRLDQPSTMPGYDLVIVGSDEVWNLSHPWYGGRSIFFGQGVKAGRIVSYAASFGSYSSAAGLDDYWAGLLRGFASLSVRDENSRSLVRHALDCDPPLVLDPCLQFPPERSKEQGHDEPYVALYGHSFPAWFVDRVRSWASLMGYRIVSVGYRNPCADEQRLAASPQEFASLLANSAAVATNFFHGCVFALVNGKPFACASSPYRGNKIQGLTTALHAGRHLADETTPAETFADLLGSAPDPGISATIEALRQDSDAYLERALAA